MSAIDHPEAGFEYMPPEAAAVYRWQYLKQGAFLTALWKTITTADEANLERLALGFPIQVKGYRWFRDLAGWWDAIEKSVEYANEEKQDDA